MRDYAEQVKALRYCGDCDRQGCAKECKYGKEHPLNFRCIGFLLADAADVIEELLAKDTNVPNKWISVEERLPEVEQSVLFCVFGRSVGEGTYRGHDGFHHVWKMYAVAGTYWDDEVTHWMPLPAPPKGVE